jgi:ABC-type glutathione transport system ATPase component
MNLKLENLEVFTSNKFADPILQIDNLTLKRGEIIFLIGVSGAGKSTLLKSILKNNDRTLFQKGNITLFNGNNDVSILTDSVSQLFTSPDQSKKNHDRELAKHLKNLRDIRKEYFSYIPQNFYIFHKLVPLYKQLINEPAKKNSFADTIMETLSMIKPYVKKEEMDKLLNKTMKEAGLDFQAKNHKFYDKKIRKGKFQDEFSVGQVQRFFLSKVMKKKNTILLVDEFVRNIDPETADKILQTLFEKVRAGEFSSCLMVAHDLNYNSILELAETKEVSSKVVIIEKVNNTGRIVDLLSLKDFRDCRLSSDPAKFKAITRKFSQIHFEETKIDIDIINETHPQPLPRGEIGKVLEFNQVNFQYDNQIFFENLNFNLYNNEFVYLEGKSGSGKSTFLKLLIGGEIIKSGEINYYGHDDHKITYSSSEGYVHNRYISSIIRYVPQLVNESLGTYRMNVENYLREIYTYYKNSIYQRSKYPELENIDDYIIKNLEFVKLSRECLKKNMIDLSGGEKQRLAIARLLYYPEKHPPRLFIFDEALTSLDINLKKELLEFIIEKIYFEKKVSILMISHEKKLRDVIENTIQKRNGVFKYYRIEFDQSGKRNMVTKAV